VVIAFSEHAYKQNKTLNQNLFEYIIIYIDIYTNNYYVVDTDDIMMMMIMI